ncbi:DeoR/GlpR transcriptional regulator [Salicibibacter cibi]|uniref:DeoR/GlpR transcriptional regulator n=1 Tax=Salicibibacter cibi TaxID=2743001 RepID=A0A7T7CEB2_9BACI|nr:DeoR/GlpR family DNA-binding transcription regulator [Salicibibacter cibi]QQK78874.1 DeoR/GlpR transcriptional regulator [Salicibibacter cibi]
MQAKVRKQRIIDETTNQQRVEIEQLSSDLNVSTMTIRRDLTELEKQGYLIRVHGGAVAAESLVAETPYFNKASHHLQEKKAIAKEVLQIIPENSRILLDSGTTTLEIIRLLKHREDITVLTNDIKLAVECLDGPLKIILTGGELQKGIGSCTGPSAEELLSSVHVDLFFLGAHAIDPEAGVTAPTFEKASIKRVMMKAAERTILVADSTKFGKKSFARVCSLEEITQGFTDANLPEHKRDMFTKFLPIKYISTEVS